MEFRQEDIKLYGYGFKSKIEAARAYDRVSLTFNKEFAALNFPKEDYL